VEKSERKLLDREIKDLPRTRRGIRSEALGLRREKENHEGGHSQSSSGPERMGKGERETREFGESTLRRIVQFNY